MVNWWKPSFTTRACIFRPFLSDLREADVLRALERAYSSCFTQPSVPWIRCQFKINGFLIQKAVYFTKTPLVFHPNTLFGLWSRLNPVPLLVEVARKRLKRDQITKGSGFRTESAPWSYQCVCVFLPSHCTKTIHNHASFSVKSTSELLLQSSLRRYGLILGTPIHNRLPFHRPHCNFRAYLHACVVL